VKQGVAGVVVGGRGADEELSGPAFKISLALLAHAKQLLRDLIEERASQKRGQ